MKTVRLVSAWISLGLLVIFVASNLGPVELGFLSVNVTAPLGLIVAAAFLLGAGAMAAVRSLKPRPKEK